MGGRQRKPWAQQQEALAISRDKERLLLIELLRCALTMCYSDVWGVHREWNGSVWCLGEDGLEQGVKEPIRKPAVGGTASRVCPEMVEQLED